VLQVLKGKVIPGLTGNLNKYFVEFGKTLTFAKEIKRFYGFVLRGELLLPTAFF